MLVVPSLEIEPGEWHPDKDEPEPGHLGYLILDGLMVREVSIAGGTSMELLNLGDLLRPWLEDAASFAAARWTAIEPVRFAVLGPRAAAVIGQVPSVMAELLDRAMWRSRSLAVAAALEHIRGIDRRLWVLLWHLAERWGEREPDGSVFVPLKLTHETLATLVGARRPSVSAALSRLKERDLAERVPGRGWRLRGEPPEPSASG